MKLFSIINWKDWFTNKKINLSKYSVVFFKAFFKKKRYLAYSVDRHFHPRDVPYECRVGLFFVIILKAKLGLKFNQTLDLFETTLQSGLRPSFSYHSCCVCLNFIREWRDLQFKVDYERQIFEKLFHNNFIYFLGFCQKSAERKSQKQYLLIFRFDV